MDRTGTSSLSAHNSAQQHYVMHQMTQQPTLLKNKFYIFIKYFKRSHSPSPERLGLGRVLTLEKIR